jgi:hypothetical protein
MQWRTQNTEDTTHLIGPIGATDYEKRNLVKEDRKLCLVREFDISGGEVV